MTLEVVHGQPDNRAAALQLAEVAASLVDDGTIYLGYPVLATADDRIEIDALLVSESHGLIAFRFADVLPGSNEDWQRLSSEQDSIYNTLESSLSKHESLRDGREFAVKIGTITVLSADLGPAPISTVATFSTFEQLPALIGARPPLPTEIYHNLQAALQRVTTIRPAKRRVDVKSDTSRGATMKVIERGIANLDFWQKKAAIETPDGPQRIRGLAGSGKTIVLALKAALLHAQNESWNIVVTFSSRALYQQFEDLVNRFSFAHMDDLPDPERLSIMHAWGSRGREGVYTRLADALGVLRLRSSAGRMRSRVPVRSCWKSPGSGRISFRCSTRSSSMRRRICRRRSSNSCTCSPRTRNVWCGRTTSCRSSTRRKWPTSPTCSAGHRPVSRW